MDMGKRTIRMLDSGPNGQYRPDQILNVDHVRAAYLVETNHAEYVEKGRKRAKPTARD